MRHEFIKNTRKCHRVVLKVGSSLICDPGEPGGINHAMLEKLCHDILFLRKRDIQVMLVSSGAVHTGRKALDGYGVRTEENPGLRRRQALSALGQNVLITAYQKAMAVANIPVAQMLLTARDFRNRRAYLNIEHTIEELLQLDALAVVNENDTVAVDELQFGENDLLSAACAAIFRAEFLLILTSVEGFLMENKRIAHIETLLAEHWQAAQGPQGPGQGGMRTKLRAAQLCNLSGINCAILPGRHPRPIHAFFTGEDIGSLFPAGQHYKLSARKKWILFSCARGAVVVDNGARHALKEQGSSLLPVGVRRLEGQFLANEVVEVKDEQDVLLGRGIINYSYREVLPMLGLGSTKNICSKNLLWRGQELIHRNNLVLEHHGFSLAPEKASHSK